MEERRLARRSAAPWAAALVLALLGCGACDSAGQPPWPLPLPVPSAPDPVNLYQLTGRVTDEVGSPVPDAWVTVIHGFITGSSRTSNCTPQTLVCTVRARANGEGIYAVEFTAGPFPARPYFPPHEIALVGTSLQGYESDVQWVPADSMAGVRDLRLRRVRQIDVGQSVLVAVGPDSSLCSDLEYFFVLHARCEIVRVVSTAAGPLVVEARAVEGGSVPLMFDPLSSSQAQPGVISVPTGVGMRQILVGLSGMAEPRRFEVVAALR